jgi:stage II sporulation protein D
MRAVAAAVLLSAALAALPRDAAAQDISVRVGIRVGVASARVDAPGSALIVSADPDAPGRRREGPLVFGVRAGAPASPARTQWDVRATVEATRKKADLVKAALDEAFRAPLRVERAGGAWAVVAGPFDDESRAKAVLAELQGAGMDDAALVRPEAVHAATGSRLVMITGAFEVVAIAGDTVRITTPDGSPIEVDGKGYRGEIEVAAADSGLLTVVDDVRLEDYLRGVVPAEMGPEVYPAIEALKAQAIAARTYALMPAAHLAEGFERCDGPHCQVYKGLAAEHPLTDRAVSETAGLVATSAGRPIHAYFSSTCGGHTEDVANVFLGDQADYLRGVPCYPEKVEFLRIPGRQLAVDFNRVDGRTAHGVLARLLATGVVTEEEARQGVFSKRARADESSAWLQRAAALAGRSLEGRPPVLNVDTAIAFLRSILQATGAMGQERLVAAQDLAAASRFRELQGLTGDDLVTGLLALKGGLLPEGLEPGWAQARLSRGNVLELIEGWMKAQGLLNPPSVRFLSARGGTLRVLAGKDVDSVAVAPTLLLLSGRPGAPQRMREALELKMGDRLRIHRDESGLARCIELDEDPDGASLDRTSAYSWWTRRIPFEQLADAAAAAGFGRLRDVRITRISDAGRVVGLELVAENDATRAVEGFAVRQLLGLPDSRCDVRAERDASGRLVAFTATGRGWGHGVGLCQVGAYGMALLGRTSEEILGHYYPGTRVQRLADLRTD